MRKSSFTGNTLLSVLGIGSGCALDAAAVYLFITGNVQHFGPGLIYLLVLHLAGVAVFSSGMYVAARSCGFSNPLNWLIACFATGSVFSVPGLAGMTVMSMFLFTRGAREKRDVSGDHDQYITFDQGPGKDGMEADKLLETVDEGLDVRPLVDILAEKDVKLRRNAISVMEGLVIEGLPRKDAVRLLKLSLQDNNVEIRFYAALGLSRIESELTSNILMAKKEVERDPASPAARLSLANSFAEYYECGILDPVTEGYYMELAVNEYYRMLDLGAEDINVLNSIGNLEVQKKNYDSALSKFRRVCEKDPYNIFANVGVIQIYYETGRIKDAMELSGNIIDKIPATKGPMRRIVEYWSS